MKKVLVPIVGLVLGFGLFAACSNDSDSANSQVSGPNVASVAKIDSISYVASNVGCGSEGALRKSVQVGRDSAHLYINKDGSAMLKEKMLSICPERGEITKISLEKLDDTLQVFMTVYEKPGPTRKCGFCYSNFEIDVPAEFVGVKYIALTSSSTGEEISYDGKGNSIVVDGPIPYNMKKTLLYFVSYVKEK